MEDVNSGAGVDDVDGVAGVDNVGRDAGRDGWSRPCVLCRSGTVAPMQRHAVSKEQWLRCRGSADHVDADIEGVEDVDDAERRGVEGGRFIFVFRPEYDYLLLSLNNSLASTFRIPPLAGQKIEKCECWRATGFR